MPRATAPIALFLLLTAPTAAPAQDRFFDSDGVRIRYVVDGRDGAEPIVFINGFTERLEVWSEVIAASQLKDYQLIRFDTRGLGLSDKPHDLTKYGIEMVEDVVRLLDHLKITRAHVVGYSMGAWITLKLVTMHPERVLTATLGGSGGLHPSQSARNLVIANALEGRDIAAAVRRLTLPDGSMLSEEAARQTEQGFRDIARQYAAELDANAVAPMMRGFAELMVADEELKDNRVPLLALYSNENDAGRPLAGQITALANRMPNVTLIQIKDANHGTARGKPGFAQSLAAFLSKNGAPPLLQRP